MYSRFAAESLKESSAMNQAMEGLEGLPDSQKQELMQKIEEMQVRDRYEGNEITLSIWAIDSSSNRHEASRELTKRCCVLNLWWCAACACTTPLYRSASQTA